MIYVVYGMNQDYARDESILYTGWINLYTGSVHSIHRMDLFYSIHAKCFNPVNKYIE